jgi:hypothetical protein
MRCRFESTELRRLRRLRQRDAVVGIARGLVQAADLRGEALRDREAGGVVLRAVDAQAGRQPGDAGGEVVLVRVALRWAVSDEMLVLIVWAMKSLR